MTKSDYVQAVAFAANFLETELSPGRGYPDAWQLEVRRSIKALRALHQQLSPNTLNAVAAEPARRSNFGNVGEPPAGW